MCSFLREKLVSQHSNMSYYKSPVSIIFFSICPKGGYSIGVTAEHSVLLRNLCATKTFFARFQTKWEHARTKFDSFS